MLTLGAVPTCVYGTPSTEEIPDSLQPYLQTNDAFLLKNHGALTVGNTLTKAFFLMEEVEFSAKITFYASQLGGVEEIPCDELMKLMELRKKFQIPGKHPGCKKCPNLGTENCKCRQNVVDASAASPDGDLVSAITAKVLAELKK